MSKKAKKSSGFSLGHLKSQKFAALIFCVFVLAVVAFFMSASAFGNLCLAVTGLYTAFVGGRAYSDGQTLKFGGVVPPGDADESRAAVQTRKDDKKEHDEDDDGPEVELHVENPGEARHDDMEID